MRLRVCSDLHHEFAPFEPPDCVDVVILAGDIDVKGRGVEFAKRFPCPVVYVPGNHEYYGGAIPHLTDKLRAACEGSNVHVLDQRHAGREQSTWVPDEPVAGFDPSFTIDVR